MNLILDGKISSAIRDQMLFFGVPTWLSQQTSSETVLSDRIFYGEGKNFRSDDVAEDLNFKFYLILIVHHLN